MIKCLEYLDKGQYVFVNIEVDYFMAVFFDMKKGKNSFEYEPCGKLDKYVQKYIKKGFIEVETSDEVSKAVEAFKEDIVLDELYLFLHEKKRLKPTDRKLLPFRLAIDGDGFRIRHYYEDEKLTTAENYVSGLVGSRTVYGDAEIMQGITFHLTILFTLGFSPITEIDLLEMVHGKHIPTETTYENKKSRLVRAETRSIYDEDYLQVVYREEDLVLKLITYYIKSNKIKLMNEAYSVFKSKQEWTDSVTQIEKNLSNPEFFKEPIDVDEFLKRYPLDITPKVRFEPPKSVKIKWSSLPLRVAEKHYTIEEFEYSLLKINCLYFYVNKTESDPLDWDVAFIMPVNSEYVSYAYSKVFKLKDFNTNARLLQAEELKYSSDREDFFKKRKKVFKKHKLKPVDAVEIIELLTQKSVAELKKEKRTQIFVQGGNLLTEVFEHYANVFHVDGKQYDFQFFRNEQERDVWLEQNQTEAQEILDSVLLKLTNFASFIKKSDLEFPIKEEIVEAYAYRNSKKMHTSTVNELSKLTFGVSKKGGHIKGDYTIGEYLDFNENGQSDIVPAKSIFIDGDWVIDGTLYVKGSTFTDKLFVYVKGDLKVKT